MRERVSDQHPRQEPPEATDADARHSGAGGADAAIQRIHGLISPISSDASSGGSLAYQRTIAISATGTRSNHGENNSSMRRNGNTHMTIARLTLFVVGLTLTAATGSAQTHPCDLPAVPPTVTSGAPLAMFFCAKDSDTLTRAEVVLDGGGGTPVDLVANAVTGPSATGFVQYRVVIGVLKAGAHAVTVTVFNETTSGTEQASDASNPLMFAVTDPKPRPETPRITGVEE